MRSSWVSGAEFSINEISRIFNRFQNDGTGGADLGFGNGEGWGDTKAVGMGKEPIPDNAVFLAIVNNPVNALSGIKINGKHQPDPPDFPDLLVMKESFKKYSFCLRVHVVAGGDPNTGIALDSFHDHAGRLVGDQIQVSKGIEFNKTDVREEGSKGILLYFITGNA